MDVKINLKDVKMVPSDVLVNKEPMDTCKDGSNGCKDKIKPRNAKLGPIGVNMYGTVAAAMQCLYGREVKTLF